jgi:hypothetical protein
MHSFLPIPDPIIDDRTELMAGSVQHFYGFSE